MRIVNRQYRDNLALTRYPFQGTEPLTTDNGETVPDQLFLDLVILVTEETIAVSLASIIVAAGVAVASFTDSNGIEVARANLSTADSFGQLQLKLQGAPVGYALVSLPAAAIVSGWPAGTYVVTAPILSHLLVVSDPTWLSGFLLPDGTVLTGDVYLVADVGLWLNATGTGFQFNVTGNPYQARSSPVAIQTINGVAPDANGDVKLYNLGASGALDGPFRVQVTPEVSDVRIKLIGGDS